MTALARRPVSPPWTAEQQAQHRADLEAGLNGTNWHQPIPARRQASRRPRKATT